MLKNIEPLMLNIFRVRLNRTLRGKSRSWNVNVSTGARRTGEPYIREVPGKVSRGRNGGSRRYSRVKKQTLQFFCLIEVWAIGPSRWTQYIKTPSIKDDKELYSIGMMWAFKGYYGARTEFQLPSFFFFFQYVFLGGV